MAQQQMDLVTLMFDTIEFGRSWNIFYKTRDILSKECNKLVVYPMIDNWSIGTTLRFSEINLLFNLGFNGGNMRRTFWQDVIPILYSNLIGSIIFIDTTCPNEFPTLLRMLVHDYSYNSETGRWGVFMSTPVIAFANTHTPDAWSIEDIKLYLREYPDLNCIAFEPDSLFAVTSLLIYALEHCASYLPD